MAGLYAIYDFLETVNHYDSPIKENEVKSVLYATGTSVEGYGEWAGGFVLRLKDGETVVVTGWCDTSGWGCRDGMSLTKIGRTQSAKKIEKVVDSLDEYGIPKFKEWDKDPIDLNRYLKGEIGRWD